ncbi:hypothetical protein ACLOJK_014301 [Asimina triloba]
MICVQEWGDPRKEEFYFYMKSYSPVDNGDCIIFEIAPTELYVDPPMILVIIETTLMALIVHWGHMLCVNSRGINIKAQNYPDILVTAGLNDPRVLYSEPAKFVAKLRDLKTDNNTLLFKCELGAGHFSKSGSNCGVI